MFCGAAVETSGNICKSLISDPVTPYNGARCVACPEMNMRTKEERNNQLGSVQQGTSKLDRDQRIAKKSEDLCLPS